MVDFALCVITRRVEHLRRGHLDIARAALRGGAGIVQLRDKSLPDRALWEIARQMRRLAQEHQAVFIVNDRLDIALAAGADGVHLGQRDIPIEAARRALGPEAVIGASVENMREASAGEEQGATYVSVGSVYATSSKADAGEAIGLAPIGEIKRATRLPVIAIGGISRANLGDVIQAGADGVAVISAVAEAEDMVAATRELRRLIAEAHRRVAEQEQSDDTA